MSIYGINASSLPIDQTPKLSPTSALNFMTLSLSQLIESHQKTVDTVKTPGQQFLAILLETTPFDRHVVVQVDPMTCGSVSPTSGNHPTIDGPALTQSAALMVELEFHPTESEPNTEVAPQQSKDPHRDDTPSDSAHA